MLPHSYTVDSQSKSQDLASSILSSTSSSQIISTCSSIDSFLLSHSPDQTRHFFSLAFPPLISKLFFGLTDSSASSKPNPSNGWIDSVLSSNDPDSANAVFSLLSPSSILFHSISAVDRLSLVKYVFPIERLPEWTRFALSSNKFAQALSDLSPLFNSKLKHDPIKPSALQIQLNVFEYYLFWFAYYPICKSNSENSDSISIKRARKFRLENWTSSIPGFSNSKRGNEQRIECNLYLRLLYAYLRAFVPIHDLSAHQPYRSSLLHYASGYDGSVTMRAEFVVNAFVHFWLVDNDFSPLPVNVLKSHGVSFPFRSVLGDTPRPASGLGEVVKLFVKYLNLSSVAVTEDGGTENCGNPRWRVLNSGSFDGGGGGGSGAKSRDVAAPVRQAGSWNAWIQRPLYRFILRTFLSCPVGSSIKNASEVFDVWITYMEPWTITWNDFAELDAIVDGANKSERKEYFRSQGSSNGYSPSWQGYVLSNYLYYSSLVMHFIGFAHKFLHSDVKIIVRMVSKVMNILTSSKELVDLIKNMDTVFHSKQAGSGKSMLNSLCRFVPSIREQLQDWEDGLCESDADGSFLHENWNKDLRLFSNGEDGGQQLLQLFILRAEAELQAISGDNLAGNLKCLDSLKAQVSCLFGGHTVRTLSFSPEPKQYSQSRDDIFKPRRVGNYASSEIKYRGDWMKRPISDDEVAWLAKLLVRFSAWLNESLGLNQAESSPAWSYVEVSTDVANVCGPTETMRAVLCAISSWLLTLAAVVVRLMKSHGLRVNLRMLASKKVVMVLLLSAVFSVVKKAFGLFHRV